MLTERKDTDPLPDWKLVRAGRQIVLLTKNNAMRLMLECWAKPEDRVIFPKKV